MQLNLTNGTIGVTVFFDAVIDRKECDNIRKSPRPVRTALGYAHARLSEQAGDDVGKFYPIEGQALVGLET